MIQFVSGQAQLCPLLYQRMVFDTQLSQSCVAFCPLISIPMASRLVEDGRIKNPRCHPAAFCSCSLFVIIV